MPPDVPLPAEVPLEVESCGEGIEVPEPLPAEVLPPPEAALPLDVPVPADGLGPTGAAVLGTATLNGLFGAVASFGIAGFGGSADGL